MADVHRRVRVRGAWTAHASGLGGDSGIQRAEVAERATCRVESRAAAQTRARASLSARDQCKRRRVWPYRPAASRSTRRAAPNLMRSAESARVLAPGNWGTASR